MTKDKEVVARGESSRCNPWRGCWSVERVRARSHPFTENGIQHLHLLLNRADGSLESSQDVTTMFWISPSLR
ncbi:hypothetical protein J4Q44_G00024940 [Coregonus suidteri]|uniref:Uncharacterized protein n=1 Tax=Coregonus suidteri TaxID=861788 RepID=A0AAN8MC37_9TELE